MFIPRINTLHLVFRETSEGDSISSFCTTHLNTFVETELSSPAFSDKKIICFPPHSPFQAGLWHCCILLQLLSQGPAIHHLLREGLT